MSALARLTPRRAIHLFAAANLAFLGVDIVIAHLTNHFARAAEWAPIVFSAVAAVVLVPGALGSNRPVVVAVDRLVGAAAVLVGVIGMVLHLESSFFERQTLHHLVYSAPFVAPLAYVGVGLVLLLVRSREGAGPELGPWALFLALGGFVGNLGLSLLDHAQNGFFAPTEWIPVAAAAYAIGFLAVELARPGTLPPRVTLAVLAAEALVGGAGFVLHVLANERGTAPRLDRFVYGAPALAPLLFANLAILAALGLWARRVTGLPAALPTEPLPET